MSDNNKGRLIALAGISGCGKSTCAKQIREMHVCQVFIEPEEEEWKAGIMANREQSRLTAFTGFRGLRVPMLYEADHCRKHGQVALVDSYFDKITGLYIENEEMNWLLPKDDPYREEIISITRKDYQHLPDADIVVLFNVSRADWENMMLSRNRTIDRTLIESGYFSMQENIRAALKTWSAERGTALVTYEQRYEKEALVARQVLELISTVPPISLKTQGKTRLKDFPLSMT